MTTGNSQLMYDVIEKMDSMVRVMDRNDTIIFMNEKMRKKFGDFTGRKCYEMMGLTHRCKNCVSDKCLETGNAENKEQRLQEAVYQVVASPVVMDSGLKQKYAIEIFQDVTDKKRIEQENLLHYQKLKEDLKFARHIQKNVLSIHNRYEDFLYAASCYQPSEDLGGDLFDIVKLDENRILFYMADVSGHGIRSSLLTIFLRQIIRSNTARRKQLTDILQELITEYHELKVEEDQYFTILIGIFNKKDMEVQFINAGHNCPPLQLTTKGSISEVMVTGMPVCSLVHKVSHEIQTVKVESGDRFLLYTDGLSEAFNETVEKEFGVEGIIDSVKKNADKTVDQMTELLVKNVEDFSGQKNKDDVAALMIEIL